MSFCLFSLNSVGLKPKYFESTPLDVFFVLFLFFFLILNSLPGPNHFYLFIYFFGNAINLSLSLQPD